MNYVADILDSTYGDDNINSTEFDVVEVEEAMLRRVLEACEEQDEFDGFDSDFGDDKYLTYEDDSCSNGYAPRDNIDPDLFSDTSDVPSFFKLDGTPCDPFGYTDTVENADPLGKNYYVNDDDSYYINCSRTTKFNPDYVSVALYDNALGVYCERYLSDLSEGEINDINTGVIRVVENKDMYDLYIYWLSMDKSERGYF